MEDRGNAIEADVLKKIVRAIIFIGTPSTAFVGVQTYLAETASPVLYLELAVLSTTIAALVLTRDRFGAQRATIVLGMTLAAALSMAHFGPMLGVGLIWAAVTMCATYFYGLRVVASVIGAAVVAFAVTASGSSSGWLSPIYPPPNAGGAIARMLIVIVGALGLIAVIYRQTLESLRELLGEQREHTRELREQVAGRQRAQAMLGAVFDRAAGAWLVVAPDSVIVSCNRVAAEMLSSTSPDDVRGRSVVELLRDLDTEPSAEEIGAEMMRAFEGERVYFEATMPGIDAERRVFDVVTTPVLSEADGEVESVLVEVHDVSGRVRAEAEREELLRKLRSAEQLEVVGRLAGGVAHDFNNVLCAILGNAEVGLLDLEDDPDHPLRETLEEIRDAGESAAGLTRQLLAFSSRRASEPRVIDPREPLTDLEKMLSRVLGEDVDLEVVIGRGPGRVLIDRARLEQVVINLVVNARDAMPKGGMVRIELDEVELSTHGSLPSSRYVRLSVSDTGTGIPDDVVKKIYEPFFTTKTERGGTGLGLATVMDIVSTAGGAIELQTEAGEGTTFTVLLPARVAPRRASTPQALVARPRGHAELVMLVEDLALVRSTVQRQLEVLGYRVHAFAGPSAALAAVASRQLRYDLLLSDVVMPRMSGTELAAQLATELPELKVLFMSGYNENVLLRHGLEGGELKLLPKPFTLDSLARAVRVAIDDAPSAREIVESGQRAS